jgi:exonuclease SbcC
MRWIRSSIFRIWKKSVATAWALSAADLTRKAASLSGGETFLASLALALALAEIVAREGGRLDAFFLDEGFGSLDAEHIALAMDGIERLVLEGQDRLIVVVSHVAGLRDRLEDLIVLAKDEVTGDTALRSGASAAG